MSNCLRGVLPVVAAGAAFGATMNAAAQDLEAARKQFVTSCGVCHTVERGAPPRQGPNLLGVYGARAASVEGFAYSPALKQADWTWDEARLDAWIADPTKIAPGTVMAYRQADDGKRALVVAYLKSIGKGN